MPREFRGGTHPCQWWWPEQFSWRQWARRVSKLNRDGFLGKMHYTNPDPSSNRTRNGLQIKGAAPASVCHRPAPGSELTAMGDRKVSTWQLSIAKMQRKIVLNIKIIDITLLADDSEFMKTLFILTYSQSHQDSLKIIKVDISIAEAKC